MMMFWLTKLESIDSKLIELLTNAPENLETMARILTELLQLRQACLQAIADLSEQPDFANWSMAQARTKLILELLMPYHAKAAENVKKLKVRRKSVQQYKKYQ